MRSFVKAFVVLGLLLTLGQGLAQIELTYWQYDFSTRVEAMDRLIEEFNAENPDVVVTQETFPYDAYQQRVAAATAAGEGPDVVQLFYGWTAAWQRAGYVEPIPQEHISHDWIEEYVGSPGTELEFAL